MGETSAEEFYCLVKTNVGIHVLNRTSTQRNFHSYFDLHECHYNGEDDDVGLLGAPQYGEMPDIPHIHRTQDFFIYDYFYVNIHSILHKLFPTPENNKGFRPIR